MSENTKSRNLAVIVAAGRGERMGTGGPKQYRQLGGKTVLQRTIEAFATHPGITAVQAVIHRDDEPLYAASVAANEKLCPAVFGGKTRQESCHAGIAANKGKGFDRVLIHDAARPHVSADTISRVLAGTGPGICAIPATAVADTIKRTSADGTVLETVPRETLALAQTPQGFGFDEILKAHEQAAARGKNNFTDDAAVGEWAGMTVRAVEGNRGNIKITTQEDLAMLELQYTNAALADVRTGTGYDVHTLGPGDHVMLCGVKIAHNQALQGHSDADVGLHALTDALLGTIGAGDIGDHFPPSDPEWKDAASDRFIAHAASLVRKAGGRINNLDVMLICEAPKIGPHRDAMRQTIARICEVPVERVSVKATTNERIGSIGRGEGIAALATATVSFAGGKPE